MTAARNANARLLRLATYASVATAGVLIGGKLVAWLLTGSVSVLASLIDSLLDAAASTLNLLAVHYSLQPPDDEHRFGHGKAEPLAGLGQAAFIAGSAVFLTIQAIERLLYPQPLGELAVGIGVMGFAIAATLVLLTFQRHVIRRTGSTAIRADLLHYLTDVLTNLATVAALLLAAIGWSRLDPLIALAIAAYILYSAGRIGFEAVQLLLDRELPADEQVRVIELVEAHPGIRGWHDLRTRRSGQTVLIQLHLELDGGRSLAEVWRIAEDLKAELHATFADADVILQLEPAGAASTRTRAS